MGAGIPAREFPWVPPQTIFFEVPVYNEAEMLYVNVLRGSVESFTCFVQGYGMGYDGKQKHIHPYSVRLTAGFSIPVEGQVRFHNNPAISFKPA